MNKILKFIVYFPNLPFVILLSIFLFIKVAISTGFTELLIKKQIEGTVLTDELKEYMSNIYPIHFKIFVSVLVYGFIIFRYLFNKY